ncbi:Phage protein [Lactococcus lactis subsp. lactis]|uniref:Phage protein n=2 Tax=Lactococcus lactis TaxID=1358 RepID=A0A0V8E0T7_LACLL|nr:Phage protein [Lactococcus lactis subsp. lactis]
MSEIEKIARHIVRQEEERQVEKIKLESEIKALEEVLEHGISTEFVEDEVIYIYSPKTAHDMREKLEENYKQLHAQLTIPRSIADMLDAELNPLERESMLETFVLGINYLVLSDELMKFVLTGNNYHVISAYLAGKALGVDLVKVVER